MTNIKDLINRIKENELTAARFQKVENRILGILNFRDFFDVLLSEIKDVFRVPYVWITFIEDCDTARIIMRSASESTLLTDRVNIISRSQFKGLVGESATPVLVNNDLKPYFKMLPDNRKYFIKSMAISPISLDGKIIGSLNQADSDPDRFDPSYDTSLLEQLAVKVSLCLSNVTAHEKLIFLAYHDPLTELLNRRVMETILKREFNRSKRYLGVLSVVFIDLDDFKIVNDSNGHEAGDRLLKYVADKLLEMTRETDIVARFAGDEFVILLPETGKDMATTMLERIQSYFNENPMVYGKKTIPVSISFGVASSVDDSVHESEDLLRLADKSLYKIKQARKNDRGKDVPPDPV
jgi:diguanylate cyclase (GGDEF)-like protein